MTTAQRMGNDITPYKGREAEPIIKAALEMYENGREIEEFAVELGVPARTIHRWLAVNATNQWHEAQQARALADYESSRKRREEARNTLEQLRGKLKDEDVNDPAERNWRLAHAREVLRAADTDLDHQRWQLERLLRRIYGQDVPADLSSKIRITINVAPHTSNPQATVDNDTQQLIDNV